MNRTKWIAVAALAVLAGLALTAYGAASWDWFGRARGAGTIEGAAIPGEAIAARGQVQSAAAAALGAVYAGATVGAWYPITPATSVMEAFKSFCMKFRRDPETKKKKFAILQAEDELAALGIDPQSIGQALAVQNAIVSPGSVETRDNQVALRVTGQLDSVQAVSDLRLRATGEGGGQTFRLGDIVATAEQNVLWWVLMQFPAFIIYMIAACAEVNRTPFDLAESETELVAGFHTEYSSMKWALFFLGEYMNMIVISSIAVTLFFGGWQPPIDTYLFTEIPPFSWPLFWLSAKVFVVASMFLWIRATFPRYRYDQIMRLGWKVFIPLTLVWIVVIGAWMQTPWNIWK